jgi:hypothetical protein
MKFGFWPHLRRPGFFELVVVLGRVALFGAGVGLLITFAGALFGRPPQLFPVSVGLATLGAACLSGVIFALCFYTACALPWIYLGPLIYHYPRSIKNPLTALIGAVGSALAITVAMELTNRLPGVHTTWPGHMGTVIWCEAAAGAVIALVIGAFKRLQIAVTKAEAQVHEREMREAQLAEAAAKAQSAALQSQINPHFFFNTLNTLSALIPADASCAQELVGRLADMFRYTLACSRADGVTLDQELEFTENYLRLEQARFRERLRVKLPRGDFKDILLPGLSLQPLVENAIKYGVAKRVEGGCVEVKVRRNGASCSVDVLSPSDGVVEQSEFFRRGHALENVRDRLKLFAGERSGVDVGGEDATRVRVSLVLAK